MQTTTKQVETQRLFTAEQMAGDYKLLMHPYQQTCAYNDAADAEYSKQNEQRPVNVTLSADGSVKGDIAGSWQFTQDGTSFITLTLDGWDYDGVAIRQNVDYYKDVPATCITAVSFDGVPVWLYKEGTTTDIKSVETHEVSAASKTYNLMGQQVGRDYKGVMIVNGKKILKK